GGGRGGGGGGCSGEGVGDGLANAAAIEREGKERFRSEVVRRTLGKDLEGHDSTEAVALAEVTTLVLERFVTELFSLRVLAQVVAQRPERAFAPDVIAHSDLRSRQSLPRARRIEKLVVDSPEVL